MAALEKSNPKNTSNEMNKVESLELKRGMLLAKVLKIEEELAQERCPFHIGEIVSDGSTSYAIIQIVYQRDILGYRIKGAKLTKKGVPGKRGHDLGDPTRLRRVI